MGGAVQFGSALAFLLASAIKVTAVLAAAYACAAALRRGSAAARYLVWSAAMAAMLALPVLSLMLPAWRVAAPERGRMVSRVVEKAVAAAPLAVTAEARAATPAPIDWRAWLLVAWAAGCAAVLARMAAGTARVWWVARISAEVVDARWRDLAAELAGAVKLSRPVRLVECPRAAMPMTWGAVILLPAGARQWPAERRRMVLLHELIHIRRLDHWVQLLSQAACAAYWFHPLAWRAAAELRREREQSCDDAVLRLGAKGSAYAEHLLELARSLRSSDPAWSTAVGMAHASHLESRLLALLDPRRNREGITPRRALLAGLAAAGLTVPLAVIGAQAQAPRAMLTGTVYDPSGAVVPQATITVTSADGKSKEITRSGDDGRFSLVALPAGKYTLEAAQRGFRLARRDLTLPPGVTDLKLTLEVGSVSETVEVLGKRPPVQPKPGVVPQRIRVGGTYRRPGWCTW